MHLEFQPLVILKHNNLSATEIAPLAAIVMQINLQIGKRQA
jgi:hypothetical protein